MTTRPPGAPAREISLDPQDDALLPFAVDALDVRGRVIRLGPAVDAILAHYDYPAPVARLLGEGVALAALLGSMLSSRDRFQLQTRSDGAVSMMIVDHDSPGSLRGFVRFDAARVEALTSKAELLGRGHMALTIESAEDASRYQGVVELAGEDLAQAAHEYFRQSEQIPTFLRLAVAEMVTPKGRMWRAGGFLAQYLPAAGPSAMVDPEALPESWNEARALAATIEDHELVDPQLSSERLLFRLFHERGVRVFEPNVVEARCRCSAERVENMLRNFSSEDRAAMVGNDGRIGVTCEFCGVERSFDPAEFD